MLRVHRSVFSSLQNFTNEKYFKNALIYTAMKMNKLWLHRTTWLNSQTKYLAKEVRLNNYASGFITNLQAIRRINTLNA